MTEMESGSARVSQSFMVKVNGDDLLLPFGSSVRSMIDSLEIPSAKVAVEKNLEVVPRSVWEQTLLNEGDKLEIVYFVGGG